MAAGAFKVRPGCELQSVSSSSYTRSQAEGCDELCAHIQCSAAERRTAGYDPCAPLSSQRMQQKGTCKHSACMMQRRKLKQPAECMRHVRASGVRYVVDAHSAITLEQVFARAEATYTSPTSNAACRSLDAFEIRSKMYAGHISSVYRAVDKNSGITVALKLYKRAMLNDMERHQVGAVQGSGSGDCGREPCWVADKGEHGVLSEHSALW